MLAQEESRRLGHNFVGTEMILLGLIGEGRGVAAKRLSGAGVHLKDARIEVEKIISRGSGFVAVEIPFTPRAKRVLELSWKESQKLQQDYIGTEHLLLGLLREGDGVACRVLENLAVDREKLRAHVLASIGKSETKLPEIGMVPTETSEITMGEPFSWYDTEATLAVQRAWGIAETAGSKEITSEHLLLAALRDNGTIYGAMQAGHVDLAQLRRDIFSKLEQGDACPAKSMIFSDDAKKTLEEAWKQSFALEQFSVPKESLFLALLADEGGVLSTALNTMGADATAVRQFIEDKMKVEKKPDTSSDSQTISALDKRPVGVHPLLRIGPKAAAIFGLYCLISISIVLSSIFFINRELFIMLSMVLLIVLIIGLAICLGAFVFNR